MQSPDDLPAKVLKKKPKPNNKTKTLAKKRSGEDFKRKTCNSNSKSNSEEDLKKSNSIEEDIKKSAQVIKSLLENKLENKVYSTRKVEKYMKLKGLSNNQPKDEITPSASPLLKDVVPKIESTLNNKTQMDGTKSREEILAARQVKKNSKKVPNKKSTTIIQNDEKTLPKPFVKDSSVNIRESKADDLSAELNKAQNVLSAASVKENNVIDKNKEKIVAERQTQKFVKQLQESNDKNEISLNSNHENQVTVGQQDNVKTNSDLQGKIEKTREEIKAEREAKKLAKQSLKNKNKENINSIQSADTSEKKLDETNVEKPIIIPEKKPALSKAERRAIQESQRAAKAKGVEVKQKCMNTKPIIEKTSDQKIKTEISPVKDKNRVISPLKLVERAGEYKMKLFKHLDREDLQEKNQFINHLQIHPAMVQLGEQVSTRTVVGSNARCISFLKALKILIQDYQTPAKKEFTRGLEENINNCVQYLHNCRPLAVSVSNAHKAVQSILRHMSNDLPESELKMRLCDHIETYIRDQIEKAAQAISSFVQQKISNGDVLLTFGCSSLIYQILEEAHNRKIDFRVIVVDSRPFCEGQELLRKLVLKEIPCTYVLINAVGFIMPEVTKILMGAHALLANGYVMARTGTAQVALVAKSFNVPVLVCCETHKFSERVQTDAIVYNELGNPDDLIMNASCKLANWKKGVNKILPLNLNYDITPPELVTAVVTEVAILPCTSVPVILRLKPTDFIY